MLPPFPVVSRLSVLSLWGNDNIGWPEPGPRRHAPGQSRGPRRQASGYGTAVRLPSNRPWVGMRHDGGREATWKRRRPGSGSARGPKGTPPKPRDAGGGPGHRSLVARGGFPARCPGPSGGRGASGLGDPSRAPRGAPRRGAAIPRGRRRSRRARPSPAKTPRPSSPRAPRPGRYGPARRFPRGKERPGRRTRDRPAPVRSSNAEPGGPRSEP